MNNIDLLKPNELRQVHQEELGDDVTGHLFWRVTVSCYNILHSSEKDPADKWFTAFQLVTTSTFVLLLDIA